MRAEPLRGKTALITGAAKRLGRAIAIALAEEGASIVVHYRGSREEAEALCGELRARGVEAWSLQADLGQSEECEGLIARTLEAAGALDVLVNSASIFLPGTLKEMRLEDLARHMQVNAWAPLALSREFARRVGKGKIVNLLDTRISGYDWGHVAYTLSKQALWTLTRMMAVELAPAITVNAVAPGLILPPPGKDEAYLEALAGTVPLKRHGAANDVAEAVVYLLRSEFVTGQVLYVDGGRHLMEQSDGPHPD